MAKGKKREPTLYRVAKFEIRPDKKQRKVLERISANLRTVWNTAHAERQTLFDTHFAPIYADIGEARKVQNHDRVKELRAELREVFREHQITLFDQINALTPARSTDASLASVTRNWQEEMLDTLDGAFKSWLALRKNGDYDARPPQPRKEERFVEISGRSSWKIKDGIFSISCPNVAYSLPLAFPIPNKQLSEIGRGTVKKFTLYRDENGRYWVSLAYEMAMPSEKPFDPECAVYIALGTSSIGIISPHGEEVMPLGRADRQWIPKIRSVQEKIKHKSVGTNVHALTPGSRRWERRTKAKRTMYHLMGEQNKLNRRECVALDLIEREVGNRVFGHGIHFIVTDLVVRSKKGKLADASQLERGGDLGLNWAAQNTGSIGYLVGWLSEKVKEHGGSVRKHRIAVSMVPARIGVGHENKIAMARALRDDFLKTLPVTV